MSENLLFKILTRVGKIRLVRLLEVYVFQRRPETVPSSNEWTVDDFLYDNIARITDTPTGKNSTRIFFPRYKQPTDFAAWSIHMLCFVLKEICAGLPENILHNIDELREVRNNLCFRDEALSDDEFQQILSILRRIFGSLAEYCGDNVQQTIDRIKVEIDEEHAALLTESEQCRFSTELVEWHNEEKKHREQLRGFPRELTMIADRIVSIRKTTKAVPPREESKLLIPVVKIVLQPNAKTLHQGIDVSKRLFTAFKETQGTNVDELQREVNQIIETLHSEDLHLCNVERGCIELHIQCSNIESFTKLIEDCVSGKLTMMFEPVERAIRQQKGFEEYHQEVFMHKDDFDRCMIELANNIDVYLTNNEMGYFVSSQRQINVDRDMSNSNGEITLLVQSNNKDDLQKFKQFNEDGRLHKTFEGLSAVLNRTYGTDDISLNVSMEQLPSVNTEQVEPPTPKEKAESKFQFLPSCASYTADCQRQQQLSLKRRIVKA